MIPFTSNNRNWIALSLESKTKQVDFKIKHVDGVTVLSWWELTPTHGAPRIAKLFDTEVELKLIGITSQLTEEQAADLVEDLWFEFEKIKPKESDSDVIECSEDGEEMCWDCFYKSDRVCMMAGIAGGNGYFSAVGFATTGLHGEDRNLICDATKYWRYEDCFLNLESLISSLGMDMGNTLIIEKIG